MSGRTELNVSGIIRSDALLFLFARGGVQMPVMHKRGYAAAWHMSRLTLGVSDLFVPEINIVADCRCHC